MKTRHAFVAASVAVLLLAGGVAWATSGPGEDKAAACADAVVAVYKAADENTDLAELSDAPPECAGLSDDEQSRARAAAERGIWEDACTRIAPGRKQEMGCTEP